MAITIRKERNLVYLKSDSKTKPYIYDVSTGKLTGLTGKQLTTIPPVLHSENWIYDHSDLFLRALANYLANNYRFAVCCTKGIQIYERIAALHNPYIQYVSLNSSVLEQVAEMWTDFVSAATQLTEPTSMERIVNIACRDKWLAKNGLAIDEHFTEDMANKLYKARLTRDWSRERLHRAVYFLTKGLYEYEPGTCVNRINEYYNWCDILHEEPTKGDFIRLYVEAKRKYELIKTQFDDMEISKYQLAVADKLSFEYGDYMVVIPTTSKEIIAEGEAQNNCVGRLYLPKVIKNSTHIVFVREKTNPTASLVTCEVSNNGGVWQFLKKYNAYVDSNEPLGEFREAYQNHLREVW